MKKIVTVICGLGLLAGCQSTETKTAALEQAAVEEQAPPAAISDNSDQQNNVAQAGEAAATAQAVSGDSPVVSGDTIIAYRPPPVGTKTSWRLAGRNRLETVHNEVTAHDQNFKGQKVWVNKSDELISYWSYDHNRLGRDNLDGSPKEVSTISRKTHRFPMKPGDSWNTTYRQTEWKPDRSRELTAKVTVAGWENITTPAGKFRVMKIVRKFSAGNRSWINTSWYSAEHGMDVKGSDTWQGGKFSWTLVKLQLP